MNKLDGDLEAIEQLMFQAAHILQDREEVSELRCAILWARVLARDLYSKRRLGNETEGT